jgi:apolipoprotein N-acyltransferase
VVVGPLICYEDVFPELARNSVLAGSDVLAVLTNNGWFGEGGAAVQHAAHSVLRAVETRRPALRCGNGGWSGWIDEFGAVRSTLTDESGRIFFRGTRTVAVTRDARWIGRRSFYVLHGDWFVLTSVVLVLVAAFLLKTGKGGSPRPPTEPSSPAGRTVRRHGTLRDCSRSETLARSAGPSGRSRCRAGCTSPAP